jgi:uncharacterized membrane protein YeaQ/YmgE (transglycosylase-associated protein family)
VILALFVAFVVLFVVLPLVGLALWTLVSTAIVGLFFGALARLVVPGSQPIGALATILSGLIGSILGGFIGHEIGVGHLATVLLEVGVAAVAVTGFSVTQANRRGLGGRRPEIR